MKQYKEWSEWEKDEAIGTLRGVVTAVSIGLIIWIFILCGIVSADVVMDMDRIMMIESSGNPNAWRKQDDSIGLFQITPIVLKEWNNFHPNLQLSKKDLWNPNINLTIAVWYMNDRIPSMLRHYKIEDTEENRIIAYNAGISYLVNKKPIPEITQRYIKKYQGVN